MILLLEPPLHEEFPLVFIPAFRLLLTLLHHLLRLLVLHLDMTVPPLFDGFVEVLLLLQFFLIGLLLLLALWKWLGGTRVHILSVQQG